MRPASWFGFFLGAAMWTAWFGAGASAADPTFRVALDEAMWRKYEFRYPATYVFAVSKSPAKIDVRRRSGSQAEWKSLPVKTAAEFFNGVECVRYDAAAGKAYVSVGFDGAPTMELQFRGAAKVDFERIAEYYDGRKAACSISLDNWGCRPWTNAGAPWKGAEDDQSDCYQAALDVCRRFRIPVSIAVNTGMAGGESFWKTMQAELDRGDCSWEPVVHAKTHPCSASAYAVHGYQAEVVGCRDEMLRRLKNIPYGQHIFEHIITCGYYDRKLLETDRGQFLFVRGYNGGDNPTSVDYATWNKEFDFYGIGGLSYKAYDAVFERRNPKGRYYAADVKSLNEAFDRVYSQGKIFYAMWHPDRYRNSAIHDSRPGEDGVQGSTLLHHLKHVSGRKDVWYVANGWLHCYRYAAEHAQVRRVD